MYRMEQGHLTDSAVFERDIDEERRTGSLRWAGYSPLADAIVADLRERAQMIYSLIRPR